MGDLDKTITYHYIKGTQFRVAHVDGFWGGGAPSGNVSITTFSERQAIPERVVHSVLEKKTDATSAVLHVGPELARQGKDGVVRELDISLIMSFQTAQKLHEFLGKTLETMQQSIAKDLGKGA